MWEALSKNFNAYIKANKLYVNAEAFTVEELATGEDEENLQVRGLTVLLQLLI